MDGNLREFFKLKFRGKNIHINGKKDEDETRKAAEVERMKQSKSGIFELSLENSYSLNHKEKKVVMSMGTMKSGGTS